MYKKSTLVSIISIISVIGILYSGYLTYYTFTTGFGACELFFFGLPSCFYGFVLYALIFVFALLLRSVVKNTKSLVLVLLALFGVVFAASLTTYIISIGQSCSTLSFYGIPPCLMGLIMFIILPILAFVS